MAKESLILIKNALNPLLPLYQGTAIVILIKKEWRRGAKEENTKPAKLHAQVLVIVWYIDATNCMYITYVQYKNYIALTYLN